jgi:hypothetical protein
MAEQRRLLAHANRPGEQHLFEQLGVTGAFPGPQGGDLFAVVGQNAGNSKIDTFLRREVDYRADWDPGSGSVRATATVTLHNDAPSSGLPRDVIGNRESSGQPPGVNWLWLNVYSPHELDELWVDGTPTPLSAEAEFGLHVYNLHVPVPAGGRTVVQLALHGRVAASETYRATWFQQPLVHPDRVQVTVRPVAGWHFEGVPGDAAGSAVVDGDGVRDGHIALPAHRDN